MTLFGFSREDVARQLSEFAKKDLIPAYPEGSPVPPGLADFTSGRQTAVDPELYFFYSDTDIPGAVESDDDDGESNEKIWRAGKTSQRQKIYKPRFPIDSEDWGAVDQDVDVRRIPTVQDGANSSYASATAFVYNPWPHPIRAKELGVCALVGGVLFALQRPPPRRIRFRLSESFADTGTAWANVLDSWGDSNLCYGSAIEVCDPRKLFAHAVGSASLATIQASAASDPQNFFYAGGSVGYAIETYECPPCGSDDPFDCDSCAPLPSICYPRFEVEQCTQSANKMKVWIPDYQNRPTGINTGSSAEYVELNFSPTGAAPYLGTGFASQWPYVDFPPEVLVSYPESPSLPPTYSIVAVNPHRFSARYSGWAIIERLPAPCRLENALNRCTPYPSNVVPEENWVITDVQYPIARWICVKWRGSTSRWEYVPASFFEGEDPSMYFSNPDDPSKTIDDYIETLPCLEVDCIADGEKGVAFWDPKNQKYYVISTNSALYGKAKKIESIARLLPVSPSEPFPLEFKAPPDGCSLEYKTLKEILVFGMDPDMCPPVVTPKEIDPTFTELDVIVGASRPEDSESECPEDYVTFTRKTISVCGYESADPVNVDICCEPCGCCLVDGTAHPGVTEEWCTEQGGTFYEDEDCPEVTCCYDIDPLLPPEVSDAHFEFSIGGFGPSPTIGTFVAGSSSFSAVGPCSATLNFNVQWTNITDCPAPGASETTAGVAVLKTGDYCCYWEITLTQPALACLNVNPWPGNTLKVPYCEGEYQSDCSGSVCDEDCDNGGFDQFPTFQVDNIGGCTE